MFKNLFYNLRFWFYDTFGTRNSVKTYIGHGDFTEVNGWDFGKRFIPCDQDEEA